MRHFSWLEESLFHVAGRTREGLLRFSNSRDTFTKRLRETAKRFPIQVLNYLVRHDSYRLLVEATSLAELSEAIQFLHGTVAREYGRRKQLEGPFWRGRFAISLCQRGIPAIRSSLEMDASICRSLQIPHPLLWKHSGVQELFGIRTHYRILNRQALSKCLYRLEAQDFQDWYIAATGQMKTLEPGWDESWETTLAMGSETWVSQLAEMLPVNWRKLIPHGPVSAVPALAQEPLWILKTSKYVRENFIRSIRQRSGKARGKTGPA
jgi:hypothetical protein